MAALFEDGCYASVFSPGLIADILAGKGTMIYTRAAIGSGHLVEGQDPRKMTEVPGYVMDGKIASVSTPVNGECSVTVQVESKYVANSFIATCILLYARDPETGEDVPYTYLSFEDTPGQICAAGGNLATFAEYIIVAVVGEIDRVTAVIDPDTIMTRGDVEELIAITPHRVAHFLTLPASTWIHASPPYIDIPLRASTDQMVPIMGVLPASYGVAASCGFSSEAHAMDGYIRMTAATVPMEDIEMVAVLIDPKGVARPGDPGYIPGAGEESEKVTLLPATAERLGGVKIGGGMHVTTDGTVSVDVPDLVSEISATDEQVSNMLDNVYGEDS